MKYLITGGAGFIGSNLTGRLLERGNEVYVIDNLSTGYIDNIAPYMKKYPEKMHFKEASILDDEALMELTRISDVVIHLAAAVGVKYIIENPLQSMETNIIGTECVLKWARKFKKKVFIASSSEVYGDQEKAPLSEEDSVVYGPSVKLRWSYAASKLVDEFLALAYHRTLQIPVVICRFFNIIGPNQTGKYGMVIPRFIELALKNQPLKVHGDGNQSRTFTYIEDAVRVIIDILDNPQCEGEVINVGGNEEIKVKDLAKKIIQLTGSSSEIDLIPYKKVYGNDYDDMRRRVPCLKKVKRLVGFEPEFSLDDGLKRIIESTKKRLNID
jgi:UDP-glucose 4-epimerase